MTINSTFAEALHNATDKVVDLLVTTQPFLNWFQMHGSVIVSALLSLFLVMCLSTPPPEKDFESEFPQKGKKPGTRSIINGDGMQFAAYLALIGVTYLGFPPETWQQVIYISAMLLLHFWTFPFKAIGHFFSSIGYFFTTIGRIRTQIPNVAPYASDLFQFIPELLLKIDVVLDNIEVLGESVPEMMKYKEYILPVMGDIILNLEIVIPIIPVIMPNLGKVAPKMALLIPKLDKVAPYIDTLMPMWEEFEPYLDSMVDEFDNLEPIMDKMMANIKKMTPVLNLMPLMHETGVLKVPIVRNLIPFATNFLPGVEHTFQRMVLKQMSSAFGNLAEDSLRFIQKQELRLMEYKQNYFNKDRTKNPLFEEDIVIERKLISI